MSLVAEAPGFIQVFSNGTVKRFAPQTVPASASAEWSGVVSSTTPTFKYKSKDVIIDSSKPITARIFFPDVSASPRKLPLVVYFHGGGFCIGSTSWVGYHNFLAGLSAVAKAIVLSVDYRLAPENKLPAAYDDCYAALRWLGSSQEPWLKQADLSRVFLSGDSAGGNIVHQLAVKTLIAGENVPGVVIGGLIPIHPYFGSRARTELEQAAASAEEVAMNDMFWKLSLPEGSDRDYDGCNFEKRAFPAAAEWRDFPAVMVFVAEGDFLKERGVMYAEFLRKKGVEKVRVVEAMGEQHVFHVWNPESEATFLLQEQICSFIHGCL
ncbi:probable carboxylesterase 17 [Andrographis paniculata]|uniref:probable carboxylesterase 17 n=1 Tax=Andrographis paniculata TaxID=175694 RepID=UPI0021E7439C|nr:probable carboxylesterase 17 [Andrographis paniculata]